MTELPKSLALSLLSTAIEMAKTLGHLQARQETAEKIQDAAMARLTQLETAVGVMKISSRRNRRLFGPASGMKVEGRGTDSASGIREFLNALLVLYRTAKVVPWGLLTVIAGTTWQACKWLWPALVKLLGLE